MPPDIKTTPLKKNPLAAAPQNEGSFGARKDGKKIAIGTMSKALRQKRDPEAEAIEKGGYSKGHGIGSG